MTEQAVRVLREVANIHGHNFQFEEHPAGGAAIKNLGSPLPRATLDACLAADAVLLGAVGSPEFDHFPFAETPEAGLLQLRHALGGFANLRPVISYRGADACVSVAHGNCRRHRYSDRARIAWRSVLWRAARDYFAQRKFVAFNTMRYSVDEIERVARVAFEAAWDAAAKSLR